MAVLCQTLSVEQVNERETSTERRIEMEKKEEWMWFDEERTRKRRRRKIAEKYRRERKGEIWGG